jgi:hypothetical protein
VISGFLKDSWLRSALLLTLVATPFAWALESRRHYIDQALDEAFRVLLQEVSVPLAADEMEIKMSLASALYAENPQLKPSDLRKFYELMQKQKGLRSFTLKRLNAEVAQLSLLASEESWKPKDAALLLKAFDGPVAPLEYDHERSARLRFVSMMISRRVTRSDAEAEWLFYLGKARMLHSQSGRDDLERFLKASSAKHPLRSEALKLLATGDS